MSEEPDYQLFDTVTQMLRESFQTGLVRGVLIGLAIGVLLGWWTR